MICERSYLCVFVHLHIKVPTPPLRSMPALEFTELYRRRYLLQYPQTCADEDVNFKELNSADIKRELSAVVNTNSRCNPAYYTKLI